VVAVSRENTRFLDAEEARRAGQTDRSRRQAAHEQRPPGACARCGRAFRGDWDRNQTQRGVVCDVCARLATEMPAMPPVGEEAEETQEQVSFQGEGVEYEAGAVQGLEPVMTERVKSTQVPGFARNWPGLFRGLLWTAAVGILLLAVYFYRADEGGTPSINEAQRSVVEQGMPDEDPPIPVPVFMWMLVTLNLVAVVASLYLTLDYVNRLPDDRFLANVLIVTPWAILLYVPNILLLAPMVIGGLGGMIYAALAGPGFLIFLVVVLYIRFDCPFSTFLMYPVFNVLGSVISFILSMVVFGALGAIFG
jgi:hypothetical protein